MKELKLVLVTLLCALLTRSISGSSSPGLEFKLYRLSVDDWSGYHSEKLQDSVIPEANSFCSLSPSDCGLEYWNETFSFDRLDIVIPQGYPREDTDLVVKFYIFSNFTSSQGLGLILPEDTTREIFLSAKRQLEAHFDTYVTYVGDEFYGIPPNERANRIIIPIAFSVLAIIAIIAIALTLWRKNKEKEYQKHMVKRNRHISTKSPRKGQNGSPKEKEQHPDTENNLMKDNSDEQESKHLEHKHISPVASQSHSGLNQDSGFTSDERHRYNELPPLQSEELPPINTGTLPALNPTELPPINTEDTDPSNKKEKHRRKRKSKKKKQKEQESYDNSALEESESDTFIQNHTITNVQSNNMIAEETEM